MKYKIIWNINLKERKLEKTQNCVWNMYWVIFVKKVTGGKKQKRKGDKQRQKNIVLTLLLKYKQECEGTKVTECWVKRMKKNEWVWWEWLNLIKKEWIWWKLGNLMKMNESDEYQWIRWNERIG